MNTRVVSSISEVRGALALVRQRGSTIALVPTMGALHAGHGQLMEQAARESNYVVASIFVNPIQFNDPGDFHLYPRTLSADVEFCSSQGVRLVFAPTAEEMYPAPLATYIDVGRLTEKLCGEFRPGHFRGVATVVMKLFQIVQPDVACFGEKDAQQLAVIRRMVRDLDVPVKIVGVPTVRESDGLAMSSRNQRLNPDERRLAPLFYRALQAARRVIETGQRDPAPVKRAVLAMLDRPEIRVEYLEIVDPGEMQPVTRMEGTVLVAGAIWLGSTRLIDNIAAVAG